MNSLRYVHVVMQMVETKMRWKKGLWPWNRWTPSGDEIPSTTTKYAAAWRLHDGTGGRLPIMAADKALKLPLVPEGDDYKQTLAKDLLLLHNYDTRHSVARLAQCINIPHAKSGMCAHS